MAAPQVRPIERCSEERRRHILFAEPGKLGQPLPDGRCRGTSVPPDEEMQAFDRHPERRSDLGEIGFGRGDLLTLLQYVQGRGLPTLIAQAGRVGQPLARLDLSLDDPYLFTRRHCVEIG